jgi:hypothetical protein
MIVLADCRERIPTAAKSLVFFTFSCSTLFFQKKIHKAKTTFCEQMPRRGILQHCGGRGQVWGEHHRRGEKSKTYVKTVAECIDMEHTPKKWLIRRRFHSLVLINK